MGVAGAGKSRVGALLALALGVEFVEGDRFHPPENVARMAAGIPLTDTDRAGWLLAIASRISEARTAGAGLVVSCSALRRPYRDVLREGGASHFVHLTGMRDLLAARLVARRDHFMPPALLESQLRTLELPTPDERAITCDIAAAPDAIVAAIMGELARAESLG